MMKFVAFSLALALCGALLWQDVTSERLKSAEQERDHWKSQALAARMGAEALAENARRCLAREAQAQADAAERAAIMDAARPRPRTETEKVKVVDDETRKRTVARLNRSF